MEEATTLKERKASQLNEQIASDEESLNPWGSTSSEEDKTTEPVKTEKNNKWGKLKIGV